MALRGCVLTRGTDFAFVDDVTYQFPFTTQTLFAESVTQGDSFWSASPDDTLLRIPTSLNGEYYEMFGWLESAGLFFSGTDDAYAGITEINNGNIDNWYYIARDVGVLGMGYRSGLIQADATEAQFRLQWRSFGNAHGSMRARSNIAVIVGNPKPIAAASFYRNGHSNSSGSGAFINMTNGTEIFDDGNCLDPVTGVFTAPAGCEAATFSVNGFTDPFDSGDSYYQLIQDTGGGYLAQRSYMHAASGRSPAPGTMGLIPCSPGDLFIARWREYKFGTQNYNWHVSAEFY